MLKRSKELTFDVTERERIPEWYFVWISDFLESFTKHVMQGDKNHRLCLDWLRGLARLS